MGDTVFINGLSAIHAGSPGQSLAFPDVNLCPPAPPAGSVPVPLPNLARAADLAGGAGSVSIGGNPMAKRSSVIARSTGNAIARTTGGGLLTHVVEGQARFVSHSLTVLVEGEPVPRHLDSMTHNHAAMPGEAVGCYLGSMAVSLAGAPAEPEPFERIDPRPFTYKIYAQASGWAAGKQRYRLVSTDGQYDQLASEEGRKGRHLVRLAFRKVLPSKLYTLYLEQGDQQLPIFEEVPFLLLQDHPAGHPRAEGVVRAEPVHREPSLAAEVPLSSGDPLVMDQVADNPEWYWPDPILPEDREP